LGFCAVDDGGKVRCSTQRQRCHGLLWQSEVSWCVPRWDSATL
jgi:hypothetical protein